MKIENSESESLNLLILISKLVFPQGEVLEFKPKTKKKIFLFNKNHENENFKPINSFIGQANCNFKKNYLNNNNFESLVSFSRKNKENASKKHVLNDPFESFFYDIIFYNAFNYLLKKYFDPKSSIFTRKSGSFSGEKIEENIKFEKNKILIEILIFINEIIEISGKDIYQRLMKNNFTDLILFVDNQYFSFEIDKENGYDSKEKFFNFAKKTLSDFSKMINFSKGNVNKNEENYEVFNKLILLTHKKKSEDMIKSLNNIYDVFSHNHENFSSKIIPNIYSYAIKHISLVIIIF